MPSDKVTCNAQDPSDATFNSGWLSTTRYATTTQATVAPGSLATFAYNIKAPANATGTHRFNGDLVLASSGARIHPEGYYQDATVNPVGNIAVPTPTPTPGSTPFPSARPAPPHRRRRHRRRSTSQWRLGLTHAARRPTPTRPSRTTRQRGRSLPARPIRRTGCARNGNGVIRKRHAVAHQNGRDQ